jgi:uncharacterized repeat protein (TIGR03803 family)
MKNQIICPLAGLIACLGLLLAGRAAAQTFTVLHTFAVSSGGSFGDLNVTNSDGANPNAGLVLSGNTLYGTAGYGGSNAFGTVFKVNTDGTGFTNLHTFTSGSDGANPDNGGLVLSGTILFGAASDGGSSGNGTWFELNTNGIGFTSLFTFPVTSGPNYTNSYGAGPDAGLILAGSSLYGTTYSGGTNGGGTVFKDISGVGVANLHSFAAYSYPNYTNKDGGGPASVLVLSNGTLYGTTGLGGTYGNGTLFKVNIDGTGFTTLHMFSATAAPFYTNSDGANPYAALVLSGNTLYGTADGGGSGRSGTVFSLNTDGTGFAILHTFSADSSPNYTNSDGAGPSGGLLLSGNILYGTAVGGGVLGGGTVFTINTNGTGFKNLYYFTALSTDVFDGGTNSDGAEPVGPLTLSGNTLYGSALDGGSSGNGTLFSINLALNIKTNGLAVSQLSGGMAQLTYLGTPGAKYALEWAHLFSSPATWTPLATNTTTPDGYLIFTNTPSGTNDFYRIRSVP